MKSLKSISFLAMGIILAVAAWAEESSGYKVLQKVPLSGDGFWDYLTLDRKARRLYVAHDTMVQVLDADTLKVLGVIEGTEGAHGVALAPEYFKGYATSGENGMVVVFDLKTLKKTGEITAQKDADAVVYDSVSGRIFTFNGDSQNSTVIDAKTDKVVKTLDLGGSPEFAAADGKGHLFDNLEDKSLVVKIDTKTLQIADRWPVAPGESPSAMAIDKKNNRLFIGCRNQRLVVMDASNGHILKDLPIGDHVDAGYFDADSQTSFSSNGDGTLTVVHEDSPTQFHLVENAKTEEGARTMAFDPKTGHILSVTAKFIQQTPTAEDPHPWPKIIPGSVHLLVIGK